MPEIIIQEADHIYTVDGTIWPSVTGVLHNEQFLSTEWFTDWARDRGSAVHQACHFYDEGDLDELQLDPAIRGHVDAYKRFIDENDYEPGVIETPVCNEIDRVAGTPDRVGMYKGYPGIIDIKSGAPLAWHGLQLAGYDSCIQGRFKRWGLYLREDGTYKIKQYEDRHDKETFRGAVRSYWWKQANGGR